MPLLWPELDTLVFCNQSFTAIISTWKGVSRFNDVKYTFKYLADFFSPWFPDVWGNIFPSNKKSDRNIFILQSNHEAASFVKKKILLHSRYFIHHFRFYFLIYPEYFKIKTNKSNNIAYLVNVTCCNSKAPTPTHKKMRILFKANITGVWLNSYMLCFHFSFSLLTM